MRIVGISDTHCYHNKVDTTNLFGDVLVVAGDICGHGYMLEVVGFANFLEKQLASFDHIVVVAGNHDFPFEVEEEEAVKTLCFDSKIHYLKDQELVIDGVKFYGSPWQPEFFDWAFNVPRGPKLAEIWAKIPEDVDVLITHGPPMGILDKTQEGQHVGCQDLKDRLPHLKQLKAAFFGHIHEGRGVHEDAVLDSLFINCSVVNRRYQVVYKPIVIEISVEPGREFSRVIDS